MKAPLLMLGGLLLAFGLSAQHLKGIVRQKDATPVPNAQVIIRDVTFSKTLGTGHFELKLPADHVAGTRIVLDVQKEGMELVDEREIVTYVRLDPDDLVVVRMAPQGEKLRETARIKENLRRSIERNYKKKFEEQQEQFHSQQDRLASENSRLGRERDQALQLIEELAKEMYRADLGGVDSTYRLAYNLFIDGKVEEAQAVVKKANLRKQLDDIKTEERQAQIRAEERQKAKKQLAQTSALNAKINISLLKFKEGEEAYELAMEADTANFDIVFDYALFLQKQKQFSNVQMYYERALALAKNAETRATVLNNLGEYYLIHNRMVEAKNAYVEALGIRKQLAAQNTDAFLSDIATTLNNLGNYYYKNQKMAEAEKTYTEALSILWQIADKYPDASLPYVAITLNNLAEYYRSNNRMAEAEKAYTEGLSIYRRLAAPTPDAFLPNVAITLNNLGEYYRNNNRMTEAENALLEALSIRRQLVAQNSDAFLPDVASTLHSLGVFYSVNKKMADAEKAFTEALSIQRNLSNANPDAFLHYLATTLNSLGVFYGENQKMAEAEKALTEALSIRRKLAAPNSGTFLPDVAMTLNNLGKYYRVNNRMPEAEKVYIEALSIYKKLATPNPNAFLPYLATTQNNLGVLYKNTKKYQQALKQYEEALQLRQVAILNGQVHFFQDWGRVLNNTSIVKDSTLNDKDYVNVARAGQLLAGTCDSLQHFDPQIKARAIREYGSLSWWALFARDYTFAERAARRCLELDPERSWVQANLGHAYLLQGDLKKAKDAYRPLKGKTNGSKNYKTTIEEDFQALEAENITHPGMTEIRTWLREEW